MTMKKGDDPADHNVDDVRAYLASAGDPEEVQRVLDAERAGKNRSTILGAGAPEPDTGPRDAVMETTTGASAAAGAPRPDPEEAARAQALRDGAGDTRPVWDVTTHGPVSEAARKNYRVINEGRGVR